MSEHNLWTRVRKGLVEAEPKIILDRVENMVCPGMPDVNFCSPVGIEGWIELKWCENMPSRPGTAVFNTGGLRDSQIVWIHQRMRVGSRVFILAQVDTMIFMLNGVYAKTFNQMTCEELYNHARFKHIGPGLDWGGLLNCLVEAKA